MNRWQFVLHQQALEEIDQLVFFGVADCFDWVGV